MNTNHRFLFLFFWMMPFFLWAQPDANDRANELARKGVRLMDAGELDSALIYLNRAQNLIPRNDFITYEIGLAYYLKKEYGQAAKVFKGLIKKSEAKPLYYQMLGNTYDLMDKRSKAVKTYEQGLEVFPNSGNLYLELGVVAMDEKDFNQAANYWEKGISVDPTHASNYYWATKLFAASEEKVWALIYGELFLNLEFNSPRSEEIGKLVFDVYQNVYTAETDTSGEFSLTKRGFTINLDDLDLSNLEKDAGSFRLLPFEGEFAMKFAPASLVYLKSKELNLDKLTEIRQIFLNAWFEGDPSSDERYPNALLRFQKSLQDEAYFVYYTYYLFRSAHQIEFEAHYSMNEAEYKDFFEWFRQYEVDVEGIDSGRLDYLK